MAQATVQEKYRDPNPVVRFVLRRFFERLGAVIGQAAPQTILDAGCGEGEILRRGILPAGTRVISLDLRPESLVFSRHHSGQHNFVCASLHAIPLADRSMDAVLCLEVLEHLRQPGSALKELARVTHGTLILSVPHEPYFRLGNVLRGKHLERLGNHPEHVQHWNPRSFRNFLGGTCRQIEMLDAFPWIIACCRFQ
jgi:2-polyprenyl-3-methyl-5-hydroxy-6-metoxy-1,4-benzoquinol methylase